MNLEIFRSELKFANHSHKEKSLLDGRIITFNYNDPYNSEKDDAVYRETRGITFDAKSGALLVRPIPKFFNHNELPAVEKRFKEAVSVDRIEVLIKMDGSMVLPFLLDGQVYFKTRASMLDVFLKTLGYDESLDGSLEDMFPGIEKKCADLLEKRWCPIFEFISPKNIIGVPYTETRLVLLCIRHIDSGLFMKREEYPPEFEDVVTPYGWDLGDVQNEMDIEGVVVRDKSTGEMFKVKSKWYLQVSKGKLFKCTEKNMINFIESNEDFSDDMSPATVTMIQNFKEKYLSAIEDLKMTITRVIEEKGDREGRDLYDYIRTSMNDDKRKTGIAFSMMNGRDVPRQKIYYATFQ